MEDIVEIKNLTKKFGNLIAVDNVSFNIKDGEIFGILGPNGAGKTTIINMLATLYLPTSGKAFISGFDVVKKSHEVRKKIGLVPQEIILENSLTARENLVFYSRLHHIPKKERDRKIDESLKIVDLENKADVTVGTFSGGMKRRLEIIKAFLHHPKLVFLDEPTLGLDPQTRKVIWDKIQELNKKHKTTIILTTHYLDEADELCDRIAIIDYGRIIALDTPRNLKKLVAEKRFIDVEVDSEKVNFIQGKIKKDLDVDPKIIDHNVLRIVVPHATTFLPKLISYCTKHNVSIESIFSHEPTLDDVFLQLTGRKIRGERNNKKVTGTMMGQLSREAYKR